MAPFLLVLLYPPSKNCLHPDLIRCAWITFQEKVFKNAPNKRVSSLHPEDVDAEDQAWDATIYGVIRPRKAE